MKKQVLLLSVLILAFAATSYAVPMRGQLQGVTPRDIPGERQQECYMCYYNICSGWVFFWSGWCYCMWDPEDPEHPTTNQPEWGVCFDLRAGCPEGCPAQCRHLTDVWMCCYTFTPYAYSDIEIFCADEHCCPAMPLGGIYNYNHDPGGYWQHLIFGIPGVDGLELCPCDEAYGLFLIKVRNVSGDPVNSHWAPFSDHCPGNVAEPCGDWRCDPGHSYVYVSCVDYCAVYGAPSPMWIDYPAPAPCTPCPTGPPPGCFSYYGTGFYSEWVIDCYITCLGVTAAEESSWSEIKALYK